MSWWKMETERPENLFKLSEKVSKLTRLFAVENLNITFREDAETACFYPGSRVLEFPYNFVMLSDDDIMMLFMTHEVGHAFWSSVDYIKKWNDFSGTSHNNIVEDIRIERLIKDKYPGLVGTFFRGYKKLYEQGFFGNTEIHPYLKFSDRLNIYAKCGPVTAKNIKFSEKEVTFYNKCMLAETEEEVFELSKELLDMDRGMRNTINLPDDVLGRIVTQLGLDVDDMDDDEDPENIVGQDAPAHEDDYYREMTDERREEYMEKLNEFIDQLDTMFELGQKVKSANANGVSFSMYESASRVAYHDYKDFLSAGDGSKGWARKQVVEYIGKISRSVDSMAQVFEMKKAAARYKNAKRSPSGKIDINNVFKYKYDNEIFAEKVIFKDDKRHGMVILIDGSGSINRMYANMIRQVILLTEYAKKIGVPFKVFQFGSYIRKYSPRDVQPVWHKNPLMSMNFDINTKSDDFYEVLSSDMTKDEYFTAVEYLMCGRTSFGGTPTMTTLAKIEPIANEFFNRHQVTNKKLFILTDGAPTDSTHYLSKNVVVDPLTKKVYRANSIASYTPASIVGKIFKDRYGIDMVSLVVTNTRRELADFISHNTKEYSDIVNDKSFGKLKFAKTKDSMGLPIFAIKPIAAETELSLDIDESTSIASAANKLSRAMSKMQISQVMLQALSEQFAV